MPHINIHLQDNTGAEYIGDEQVIFVPGDVEIQDKQADANNCCYISSSDAYKLVSSQNGYFKSTTIDDSTKPYTFTGDEEKTVKLVRSYLEMGYDVVYCNTDPDQWTDTSLDFLLDKDSYNVKFLTTGIKYPIDCTVQKSTASSDAGVNADNPHWMIFDYKKYNILARLAKQRKDCMVPASVGYNTQDLKDIGVSGDLLADAIIQSFQLTGDTPGGPFSGNDKIRLTLKDYPTAVEKTEEVTDKGGNTTTETEAETEHHYFPIEADNEARKFSSLLIPNTSDGSATKAYLRALSEAVNNNQEWLPIANSSRGQVVAAPDLKVTKYHLDKAIIKDKDFTSFNGIVTIRPYGNVIWGDRTLLQNSQSVSASSYISLMLVVCDISKRAYQASVRYTYESNNSVTWLNYKSMITPLLDQMVSSGVLQSYNIEKITANSENSTSPYNTMICKITVYPNLPVENFEIYINLENADLTLEND